jgi:hypothetical protein
MLTKIVKHFRDRRRHLREHRIKERAILRFASKHAVRQLVETGTYLGEMVEAMRGHFSRIYSIELSADLAVAAKKRFAHDTSVEIIQGDSGKVLERLVPKLDSKALFWLDGHYSGGVTALGDAVTPIQAELGHILASPLHHVILIDDARLFGSDPGYPTVESLKIGSRKLTREGDILVLE